jgi:hypothetical protein
MDSLYPDALPATSAHRWIELHDLQELEAWLDLNDRELRKLAVNAPQPGQGICFELQHGGEIYLHTTADGTVLLDVTEPAEWVAPVILATTGVAPPKGQIWFLPPDALIPLIFGLNSLIATSRLVPTHRYRGIGY